MKSTHAHALILVTAPDLKTARALAKAALTARLIACANLVPKIESHYWWQGKIQRTRPAPSHLHPHTQCPTASPTERSRLRR